MSIITADKYIGEKELKKIEEFQRLADINTVLHRKTLSRLSLTEVDYEQMKVDGKIRSQKLESDLFNECSACLINGVPNPSTPDHLIIDCMHLCLCEKCAVSYKKQGSLCPKCNRTIKRIIKTYK